VTDNDGIIGFFASCEHDSSESDAERDKKDAEFASFRSYIWGDGGFASRLGSLRYTEYGHDLKLVLFQFYVFPSKEVVDALKEVEPYRAKEKSIGVSVIVTEKNFFDLPKAEQQAFFHKHILRLINELLLTAKQKKLDTNLEKLLLDVQQALES
jgi:hypothetical protein